MKTIVTTLCLLMILATADVVHAQKRRKPKPRRKAPAKKVVKTTATKTVAVAKEQVAPTKASVQQQWESKSQAFDESLNVLQKTAATTAFETKEASEEALSVATEHLDSVKDEFEDLLAEVGNRVDVPQEFKDLLEAHSGIHKILEEVHFAINHPEHKEDYNKIYQMVFEDQMDPVHLLEFVNLAVGFNVYEEIELEVDRMATAEASKSDNNGLGYIDRRRWSISFGGTIGGSFVAGGSVSTGIAIGPKLNNERGIEYRRYLTGTVYAGATAGAAVDGNVGFWRRNATELAGYDFARSFGGTVGVGAAITFEFELSYIEDSIKGNSNVSENFQGIELSVSGGGEVSIDASLAATVAFGGSLESNIEGPGLPWDYRDED